jgi:DNA-binding NtrC family response regulator
VPTKGVAVSRILIYEPRRTCDECRARLAGEGREVVVCRDRESLIDAIAEQPPDVLVYVLEDFELDLGVLTVVRRAAPRLPLILLGGPADLVARRSVQELKPTYNAVFPLEPFELSDAVRSVLACRLQAR